MPGSRTGPPRRPRSRCASSSPRSPTATATALVRNLRRRGAPRVVVLTRRAGRRELVALLSGGLRGVVAGEPPRASLPRAAVAARPRRPLPELTAREISVLKLVADGRTNRLDRRGPRPVRAHRQEPPRPHLAQARHRRPRRARRHLHPRAACSPDARPTHGRAVAAGAIRRPRGLRRCIRAVATVRPHATRATADAPAVAPRRRHPGPDARRAADRPSADAPERRHRSPSRPTASRRSSRPREALAAVVAAFGAGTGPVAVDAERASGYRYGQRTYLVQLRREGAGTALIDPDRRCPTCPRCRDALVGVEWVLHAASQDLPGLAEQGMRPSRGLRHRARRAAARASSGSGWPRSSPTPSASGLAKEHSAVDWSTRPLPARVAAVRGARRRGARRAARGAGRAPRRRRQGRVGRAGVRGRPHRTAAARRASSRGAGSPGLHAIRDARRLAVVRELWETRDAERPPRDISPGRVLPDAAIVAAAQALPAVRRRSSPRCRRSRARAPAAAPRCGSRPIDRGAGDCPRPSCRRRAARTSDAPPPPRAWADRTRPPPPGSSPRARSSPALSAEPTTSRPRTCCSPTCCAGCAGRRPPRSTPTSIAAFLRRAAPDRGRSGSSRQRLGEAFAALPPGLTVPCYSSVTYGWPRPGHPGSVGRHGPALAARRTPPSRPGGSMPTDVARRPRAALVRRVVFVDGVRTPFGRARKDGLYAHTRADDLVGQDRPRAAPPAPAAARPSASTRSRSPPPRSRATRA